MVLDNDAAVALSLGMPSMRADVFCIGWDYGYSPDPSMLVISYEVEEGVWECYARIQLQQIALPIQCRIVRYLYNHICLGPIGAICCDSTQAIQMLQHNDPDLADRFHVTQPGGSVPLMDQDTGEAVMKINEVTGRAESVTVRTKQYLTEIFRQMMINSLLNLEGTKLWLGQDTDMIDELAGTTERKTPAGYTVYIGPPDPNRSSVQQDHACLIAGTLITTDNGETPIEHISPGDRVLTRRGYRTVLNSGISSYSEPIWTARFSNGASLSGTFNHPVWVEGKGFVDLDRLRYLDKTATCQLNAVPVHVLSISGGQERKPVYNLTVDEESEFFANGVLTHNTEAARYMTDAILRATRKTSEDEGEAALLEAMGWAGKQANWESPW